MTDVLIAGGGVMGLAIGWRLARAGVDVTVLERDGAECDRPTGAWWASAGMLAPLSEAGFDDPDALAFGRASLALYPQFAAELEADAGQSIGLRTEGTVIAAADRDEAVWLRRQWTYHQELGLPTQWMSGDEAREREPHLGPRVPAALFAPTDHQVDSRLLGAALRRAFLARGGTLRDGWEVARIDVEGGRARGVWARPVATLPGAEAGAPCGAAPGAGEGAAQAGEHRAAEERIAADRVLVCTGSWTRLLLADGETAAAAPRVRPVKGQLLALEMSPLLTLAHVVRTRRVYLVPRADGRLVIGATSEEAGFDMRMTAGGVLDLLRDAWEVLPGIYDLPLLQTWAGLRPVSRDGLPVLGATPVEGLFLATGHGRNGILLTPATAMAMAELLMTGTTPDAILPFALSRFG
ncbi:MAG TPA: FAD-dependent oxidoreductase [Longimicrobium sp.]|jgi:glycine oxidase|uniref:FAD-dependent oxidoreductase n=1 Tax=Longimicrobium sp. TaxID=2029185 RepID=UPI002EDB94BD